MVLHSFNFYKKMFYKDIGLKFAKVKEYFKNKPARQAEIMCVKNSEIDYNYRIFLFN